MMKRLFSLAKFILLGTVFIFLLSGCGNNPESKTAGSGTPADSQDNKVKPSLFAYVGAGLKEPVSEIVQLYEEKTGVKVELTFNNSGALLNQLETSNKGDIYMPGGMPYVETAKQKGYIEEMVGPIAIHTPVIVAPKGNPAQITKTQDLTKAGVKLVMPEKEATALGKAAFQTFDKLGISEQIEKNVLTYVETAPKVVTTLTMGQGNAGITEYSNYAKQQDKLDLIEIDPAVNVVEEIPCALLVSSEQKEQAKDFLQFMQQEGPAVFAKHGFKVKN
ncbi:molybdate ABC transporter substrate-binding protein [Desulforamulus ruminis]|uniref:Extracellular solute-binding protein family 1 n=1 Tax=Desulforamulus ruminis (strain ATCC 23193 / DSM 2154 / NCIMB 8452 / DL) TaxID=696281 RepID=F6DVD7_DESRL|nr:molybdate ABC transporter substrate-binding protein [Desulforamulus ruminis]AEG60290.1 extracellular solute-binding protein family 1 [Desulforamulus ruminis DSM 2154]